MSREKSDHQERVERFMALAKQDVPSKPTMPDEVTRLFRAKLILEEALETIDALGVSVDIDEDCQKVTMDSVKLNATHDPNMEEIVDGCADVIVVTTGTLSACGVADITVQEEVDEANLRKFGPGSYKRADGKWMKPPDFQPPDIEKVLAAQAK